MRLRLVVDGEVRDIEVERVKRRLVVRVDGVEYRTRTRAEGDLVAVRIGDNDYTVQLRGSDAVLADGPHRIQILEVVEESTAEAAGQTTDVSRRIEIRPPMPGRVVRVAVTEGERVRKGQPLLVLEAMKMQNEIPATADGIVRGLRVSEGETISIDRVIASIEVPGRSGS